jgi:hypothetical protein
MRRFCSILGNSGAALSMALAVLTPFVLLGVFEKAIGSAGLRINPVYSGGETARVIQREGYRIVVNRQVARLTPLQRVDPFVQMTWAPAAGLPETVADEVDLDGDGKPDVRVRFSPARLEAEMDPLGGPYRALRWQGMRSFSQLIARVNDGIVVRLPLN